MSIQVSTQFSLSIEVKGFLEFYWRKGFRFISHLLISQIHHAKYSTVQKGVCKYFNIWHERQATTQVPSNSSLYATLERDYLGRPSADVLQILNDPFIINPPLP